VSNVLYAVEVAVALGLIIFVHELGHFLAAKAFGVWVRRFAIGFGPPLLTWTWGETEYSLRALPLGGFVEPMGEHPDSEGGGDARALWRRPAWQRAVVFAAGVAMNAVLAVIFFTVASVVGIKVSAPVVGAVMKDSPAEAAGLEPGDRIVAINGEPIESWIDITAIVSFKDAGTAFDVAVERLDPRTGEPARLTFPQVRSRPGDLAPRIGIEPAVEPVIYEMLDGAAEAQAGLRPGDRIRAVNGRPVTRWRQMQQILDDAEPGPTTLEIERGGRVETLTIDPATLTVMDLGMRPVPFQIHAVVAGSPAAEAGVKRGDRVARIGDVAWPTAGELADAVKEAGDGGAVRITLWRDGRTLPVDCRVAVFGDLDRPRIGIAMAPALGRPLQIGAVDADGPAAAANLRPGDVILAVGRPPEEPATWDAFYAAVQRLTGGGLAGGGAAGLPAAGVPLLVRRGGAELGTRFAPTYEPPEKFNLFGSRPGPLLAEYLPRIYDPLAAAARGFRRTALWLARVYANIRQIFKGQVSTESVGGPVEIVRTSLAVAERGAGAFIHLWGILSVCIAVFNFLPVPPFDGGHVLFVVLDTIKGSPIGLKVRTWIWGAGWVAVVALFLLITYQDLVRWLM